MVDMTRPAPSDANGRAWKRLRKGTRSCFECRRRKIRCIFRPESPSRCSECFTRGTQCIDQEHADPNVIVDQRKNLRERVACLEKLVESLLEERDQRKAAEGLSTGGSSHTLSKTSPHVPSAIVRDETQDAMLPIFQHALSAENEGINGTKPSAEMPYTTDSTTLNGMLSTSRAKSPLEESKAVLPLPPSIDNEKNKRVCKTLLAALPSHEKVQQALEKHSLSWSHIVQMNLGPDATAKDLSIHYYAQNALAQDDPVAIARIIQMVATVTDDTEFDELVLLVDELVIGDDEYMGTVPGLECLHAQMMLYSSIGQARRSWLLCRRGMMFAQLMGLHKVRVNGRQDMIWWAIFQTDRFSSLMLGTPYSISESHCNMGFRGKDLRADFTPFGFICRLALIVGKVIDQLHSLSDAPHTLAMAIDQELNCCTAEMPAEFWIRELYAPKDLGKAERWKGRLFGQMVYYQTKLTLHMPYMLKSATNPSFEYSRESCLAAARGLVLVYHSIRAAENAFVNISRACDFVGFLGCITLLLGILGYGSTNAAQNTEDWELINSTLELFNIASTQPFGKLAAQSYRALHQLTEFRQACLGTTRMNAIKVVVPFFGSITLHPPSTAQETHNGSIGASGSNLSPGPAETMAGHEMHPQSLSTSDMLLEPRIEYEGPYMHAQHQAYPQSGNGMSNVAPQERSWQQTVDLTSFDLDEDWNWFTTDTA